MPPEIIRVQDLPATIRSVLAANQDTLRQMNKYASEERKGDAPVIHETISEGSDGYNVDIHVRVRYTGEPKGNFSVRIDAKLEDTKILIDVKESLYEVHDELLPEIKSVVQQDYPSGSLKISEDVEKDDLEAWLVKA